MTPTSVTLFKEAPEANMRRQYNIEVVRDLFGAAVVTCRWGRIGTRGQGREYVCANIGEAQALAAQLVRKREARGYVRHRAAGTAGEPRAKQSIRQRRRPSRCNNAQLAFWPAAEAEATAPGLGHRAERRAAPVPVETPEKIGRHEKAATMPSAPAASEAAIEAERQARIERILAASEALGTQTGRPLQVRRATELEMSEADSGSLAYKRELAIAGLIGVPTGGWSARQRQASLRR